MQYHLYNITPKEGCLITWAAEGTFMVCDLQICCMKANIEFSFCSIFKSPSVPLEDVCFCFNLLIPFYISIALVVIPIQCILFIENNQCKYEVHWLLLPLDWIWGFNDCHIGYTCTFKNVPHMYHYIIKYS